MALMCWICQQRIREEYTRFKDEPVHTECSPERGYV